MEQAGRVTYRAPTDASRILRQPDGYCLRTQGKCPHGNYISTIGKCKFVHRKLRKENVSESKLISEKLVKEILKDPNIFDRVKLEDCLMVTLRVRPCSILTCPT